LQKSWKELIAEIVERLPQHFDLGDLLKCEPELARAYPDNKHIGAKIRQTLQILRDRGAIAFEGRGKYSKTKALPRVSPLVNFTIASVFTSRAQIARVVLELWAEYNLFCLECESDSLTRLTHNTPVSDFECDACNARYQIKGKDGRFGPKIPGAAYEPTVRAIRANACPNYILLEYDRRYSTIVFGSAIRGTEITEDRIIEREALRPGTRRAGWVGCSILLAGLPRVAVIEPRVVDPARARAEWNIANEARG
jgi:hypothetical protein